ncbi:MAG: DHH family phosphoesterase, partial [Actinomycetota bacterium]|nr:DHH family phosphoesterase [Actinomycetota bacterium]
MTQAAFATTLAAPRYEPSSPLRPVPDAPPAAARPPIPRLEIPAYDLPTALVLERELGLSHPLAQILVRRGLSDLQAARDFLNPTEAHEPSAFNGIDRAVETIDRHIRNGTRITVHGDYDVDGVCATAILVRALRSLGANAGWFLPARIDDGYGLSLETVGRLASRGSGLLITVDCAIS